MRNILAASLAVIFLGCIASAQKSNSDTCKVFAADVTGKQPDDMDSVKENLLGTFETIIGEEIDTTKIYRLPNTRLFVIANVFYTDESLASEQGHDSIAIELSVSTERKRDVLRSVVYADSEMSLNSFAAGRVTTMLKAGRRTFFILMECRKHVRINSNVMYPEIDPNP